MKLRLVAVGKLKDPGLRALCDDYQARIRRHTPFEETELRDSAQLDRFLTSQHWVVALEVSGRAYSSSEFAQALERWQCSQRREVVFLIGAADGLPAAVSQRADAKLSLSQLTLPHRLARLLLCEQIYRGFSILRNEPYAREE